MTDAAATAEAEAGAPPEEPEEPAAAPEEPAAAEAPPVEEGPPPEERTARAEAAKEEGNALLKAGDAKAAVAKYGEGITLAEPLLEKDPGELGEELQLRATTAYTALRLNSAQACLKCCEWLAAIEHADKVLLLDKDNTKALYRRGCASAQLNTESRLEQARADFARVATLDPANREVRGQLAKAKDLLKDLRQAEKQRLSAVMSGGLYQKEHAKLEGRQAAYQEEVQRRKDAGEDEISFEDWQKKEKEKEEEAKKKEKEEREKARTAELERQQRMEYNVEVERRREAGEEEVTFEEWLELERKRDEELRRERIGGVVQTDDADLDAEERRLLQETKSKGYYHGRLGTVLSDAAPKPQQVAGNAPSQDTTNGQIGSEWNQAGTWEEKDMTSWAKERLTAWLQQSFVSVPEVTMPSGQQATATAKVTRVKSLSGDAQLVTVRKKPKHGYNFEADLSFSLSFKGEEGGANESVNGNLSMPELADFVQPADLRIEAKWKGSGPSSDLKPLAVEWVDKLRENVRCQVSAFREEYQQRK